MMKVSFLLILVLSGPFFSHSQSLPFYYEHNLPLLGNPGRIAEYYYEYHTQVKAHYYDHTLEYDSSGRIKIHVKSNKNLLNPDSIPLTFRDIIDPRAITITYLFKYDDKNRLSRFTRHQYQEEVGTYQQDEEWKYDNYDMLTEHNFWEINDNDTILKNPSVHRKVFRDSFERVKRVEKYTYSFAAKALLLSEIIEFSYHEDTIDTVAFYRIYNGIKILNEKRYNITFQKFDPFNTDSVLYAAYTSADEDGLITKRLLVYDELQREIFSLTTATGNDTVTKTSWIYEPLRTIENTDHHSLEIYYDETGYEKYREEFENGSSLAIHSDRNTRLTENGKINSALLEIWDPVTLFYRRDTEYVFYYGQITGLRHAFESLNERKVYPNPASEVVHIDNLDGIQRLELISPEGKTTRLPLTNAIPLNVPKGIYILCASFLNSYVQRTKIVVE